MINKTGTTLAFGALILLAATVGYGLEFEVIELSGSPAVPITSEQWDAFEMATDRWEVYFADPVTIVIDVVFEPFPLIPYGDTLGLSLSRFTTHPYTEVRAALVRDADFGLESDAVDTLPAASLPVIDINGSRSDDMITMTSANAKALGLGTAFDEAYGDELPNSADAFLSFNHHSAADFDYDPRDGISAGKHDFVGIVEHEIAHVLGFGSSTDLQDFNPEHTVHPRTLDLWRFAETGGPHDLGTESRRITAGPAEYYDSMLNNVPMSHGMNDSAPDPDADTPTGYAQASHWSDHLGYLMDPTLAHEVRAYVHVYDVQALDHVGYDPRLIRPVLPPREILMGFFRLEPDLPVPGFGGAFGEFAAPPHPSQVNPPFEADFAVRIGLDFGPGLENRGGAGYVEFEDERQYDGETIQGLSYDLFPGQFNEDPPREPITTIPPTIMDFYFESDSDGIPFTARMLGGEHGVQYDPTLGPFGGYRIPLALDGFGDNVWGDVDAVATVIMLADQLKVPDPWAENIFQLGPDDLDNSLIVYDAKALGIPEPSTLILLAAGALGVLAYAWRRRRER